MAGRGNRTSGPECGDNDREQAARYYQRALNLDPANTEIIAHDAVLVQLLDRQDEAWALLEELTAQDPVSLTRHFNLGVFCHRFKLWDESIASFQTVLKLRTNASLWTRISRSTSAIRRVPGSAVPTKTRTA